MGCARITVITGEIHSGSTAKVAAFLIV